MNTNGGFTRDLHSRLTQPLEPAERVERAHQAARLRERASYRPGPYIEESWDETPESPQAWRDLIPSRLRWAAPEDFHEPIAAELATWGREPRGRNLVILGPVGVGKSHAAVAACRWGAEHGIETRFLPTVELFELLRPNGPPGALWDLMEVERLILDDVGAERPTDWSIDRLYALINRRWLEERPTVITTNLEPSDLESAVRPDTYSRMVGSDAVILRLAGEDRRRNRSAG